jgi:hypothetical protein
MITTAITSLGDSVSETSATKESAKEKKADGRWALFTGIGSFVLYLFGYLSLRFHLSVLGVDTGLSVLDERYLFAGAQFLVYLLTSAPVALILVFAARWVLRRVRLAFLRRAETMVVSGVVVSIVAIQFVMRQCLPFTNLLLRRDLPPPGWVQALLLDDTGALQSLYFSALLAWVLGLAWLLVEGARQQAWPWPAPNWILASVVSIQFLLLPVNFGVLIADQDVPRVTTMDGKEDLKSNVQAWRVWEGKESTTFFVRRWDKDHETSRTLVSLDKESIKKTEIAGYDRVFRLLYPWPGDPTADNSGDKTKGGQR